MEFPEELRYTKEHEWVRIEDGDRARVGITDFAQDALGDVVYVDMPESTKSVSDVYSPLAGTIVERNPLIADHPELVNEQPYGDGWLVVLDPDDLGAIEGLLDAASYREFTDGQ